MKASCASELAEMRLLSSTELSMIPTTYGVMNPPKKSKNQQKVAM